MITDTFDNLSEEIIKVTVMKELHIIMRLPQIILKFKMQM